MYTMNDTSLTFKPALWIKFFIPFGISLFLAVAIGLFWLCYMGIRDEEYTILIILFPLIFFMFYLSNMGIILFKYRNLRIEIVNEKIRIINNGEINEHKWNEGLKVKDRNGFQVFELFDSNGKRLFMIDYYFPDFSILSDIINKKISNPNKDLAELIP